jgi:hypothetical protein
MPEHEQQRSAERSLEMRVAAIEDKLAQVIGVAEEIRAYQRVAPLTAAAPSISFACVFCWGCVISIPVSIPTTCRVGPCGEATQQVKREGSGPGFGSLGA